MISELTINNKAALLLKNIYLKHPSIRPEKLIELKKLDPTLAIYAKLVKIFHVESSCRIPEMKAFCNNQDYENFSRVIHRFKSTVYNLGASRAAEIIKEIEAAIAKSAKPAELNELLGLLTDECSSAYQLLVNFTVLARTS